VTVALAFCHTQKVKVKTSICIARLMYKTPLTRISSLKLSREAVLGHRPQPANTVLRSDPTTSRRQRQPAVGLYLRNPSLMDYYSFNRPRRDGWLSWPCWLTDRGRFTHKVVTRPAIGLEQDRESSLTRTGGLTTILRHHTPRRA